LAHLIDTLREDHRNISRLLDAFEHEIEMLAAAKGPDYELLRGIANYFCDYPDRCHHPKENAVFEQLRAKYPGVVATIGDLRREHFDAAARAQRFRDNVQALFSDAVMLRDTVTSAAHRFIEAERAHMKMEEERFFPIAEQMLSPEDWQSIEDRLRSERDPLFGDRVEASFASLRERLLAWERGQRPD
jgi:hemerythrin-like domain-containing protein